jgi:3-hydroxyacyl-[acyl-carrier-protein] dehydratase
VPIRDPIVDYSQLDVNECLADIEIIRRFIPQRHEMEQLSRVIYEDIERKICVGCRDVGDDEFWVRGHMPGMPLMPGVIMCEAAAQLCCYFAQRYDLSGCDMIGFGGLESVRFRGMVRPGDCLVIAAELTKVRRGAMIVSRFQCAVGDSLVCEGNIKGIPLPLDELIESTQAS